MNIIEIAGNYFRVDQIQAITTTEDDEVCVHLIGKQEGVLFMYDTQQEAEAEQADAVKDWINALP